MKASELARQSTVTGAAGGASLAGDLKQNKHQKASADMAESGRGDRCQLFCDSSCIPHNDDTPTDGSGILDFRGLQNEHDGHGELETGAIVELVVKVIMMRMRLKFGSCLFFVACGLPQASWR